MLEEQKDFPSDGLLVRLVRLRLIAEKVIDISWSGMAEGDHFTRPLVTFYLKSLQAQLNDFKSSIPSELTDNRKSFVQDILISKYTCELSRMNITHHIGTIPLTADNRNATVRTLQYRALHLRDWFLPSTWPLPHPVQPAVRMSMCRSPSHQVVD